MSTCCEVPAGRGPSVIVVAASDLRAAGPAHAASDAALMASAVAPVNMSRLLGGVSTAPPSGGQKLKRSEGTRTEPPLGVGAVPRLSLAPSPSRWRSRAL